MATFFAITLTLFFVIDALGNIPAYLHLLQPFEKKKRMRIAIQELLIALALMILFNFVGKGLLTILGINAATVQLAGGIVLFLIAIRLIFSQDDDKGIKWRAEKPFIVPIATPIIAGPSVLAAVMIFAQENHSSSAVVLGAIFLAWLMSSVILLFARPIFKLITEQGLNACQRLMGLIVGLIAVQLFLEGIVGALKTP